MLGFILSGALIVISYAITKEPQKSKWNDTGLAEAHDVGAMSVIIAIILLFFIFTLFVIFYSLFAIFIPIPPIDFKSIEPSTAEGITHLYWIAMSLLWIGRIWTHFLFKKGKLDYVAIS